MWVAKRKNKIGLNIVLTNSLASFIVLVFLMFKYNMHIYVYFKIKSNLY
jgi:hypothetical protein